MVICRRDSDDPLLRALLQQHGMNLLVPPQTGIDPGDLIAADRSGRGRKADWDAVLGVTPALEPADGGLPTSLAIEGSSDLGLDAGTTLTGRVLSSLGLVGGRLRGELERQGVDSFSLSITAPSKRALANLDAVMESLRAVRAAPRAAFADAALYIVTAAFRARGLRISLSSRGKAAMVASADVAKSLEAGAALKVNADAGNRYSFEAGKSLVFGIAVRRLMFEDGGVSDQPMGKVLKLRGGAEQPQGDFISVEDAFVELEA